MSLNSINNLVSGRRHLRHKRDITKEVLVFLIMLMPGCGGCCGKGCRVDRGSDGRPSHRSNYSAGLGGDGYCNPSKHGDRAYFGCAGAALDVINRFNELTSIFKSLPFLRATTGFIKPPSRA